MQMGKHQQEQLIRFIELILVDVHSEKKHN